MDFPINRFKRAIVSGKTPFGAWLMSATPSTAEALGCVGFDFLVVDMEHTPIDTPQMIGILQTIAGTPAQAVVRPPWNDMVMVKRCMDAGAQTLLFPFVQNADEARRAVASTRYPPQGVRGVAGTHRGSRYGTVPNYLQRANDEVCVIVQIETHAGVRPARGHRRGARRRFDFHRPRRSVGVDGLSRRHRQRRGAGKAQGRRAAVQAPRQAVRHRRRQSRHGGQVRRVRLLVGRGRFRPRLRGDPRHRIPREDARRACRPRRRRRKARIDDWFELRRRRRRRVR